MNPAHYLYIGVSCFISSAVISLLPPRKLRGAAYLLSAFGTAGFAVAALYLCFSSPGDSGAVIPAMKVRLAPFIGLEFRGDALSGFFSFVISGLGLSVSLYAIGHTDTLRDRRSTGLLFNILILSLYGIVLSANSAAFLVSWEVMAVVSYFLVTMDRGEQSVRAGLVYAVMIHIGSVFIIGLFLLLFHYCGSMDFQEIRKASSAMPGWIRSLVFIFSLLGFGTMAGVIPFHSWLSRACSAAPSHIAALMSGVMIKTGIFGFLRVSMDILGQGPEWWGISVIVIAAGSSIGGAFSALREDDLKRALAYAGSGGSGIILVAAGASMIFMSNAQYGLSAVALSAGLYHVLNHSLFKGLLFLSSGSLGKAPRKEDRTIRRGLFRTAPYAGLFFLIGSLSLSALPPSSGFVSTWLTYQALLPGLQIPSPQAKIAFPLGIAALALSSALAAAASVKAFGRNFLERHASHDTGARQLPFSMIAGMALLACLCIISGLFPDTVMSLFSSSVFILTGSTGILGSSGIIHISQTGASLSPVAILAAVVLASSGAMIAGILIARWTTIGRIPDKPE